MRPRVSLVFVTLSFSLALVPAVVGQKTGSGGVIVEPTRPVKPKADTPGKTTVIRVDRPVPPLKGRLFVVAETGASVSVVPVRGGRPETKTVPNGEGGVFFDLMPGRYKVSAKLEGFHEVEKEAPPIARNGNQQVNIEFEPIRYSVTINTNVDAGELKYGLVGETPKVQDFQNKSIKIDLQAGDYAFEITASGFGFETGKQTVSVRDNKVIDLPLKRVVLSTETLAPIWSNAELTGWEGVPSTWRVDSKKLAVKGVGVALPKNNRYYQDFRLESNVNMTNGVAVSFVLRARDSNNYYLVQLTGAKNLEESNVVRLLVVKNGKAERVHAIPISGSKAAAMASGQFFNLSIKMVGYDITVDIVDNQTGEPYHLGVLTDPAHNFAVGAVGIAVHDNEENMIERFVVCTGKCLEG